MEQVTKKPFPACEGSPVECSETTQKPVNSPRSLPLARAGIETAGEFARMMSALMSDVIEGSIGPDVANAAINAGGKLLKVCELQLKYGRTSGEQKILELIPKS